MDDSRSCYLLASWLDNRAVCGCGHTGKRRLFRAGAALDVVVHCQSAGHRPASWEHCRFDLVFD